MKLVVMIEPEWEYRVHKVEVELDSADFADYTAEELEPLMAELAEDVFNSEVSYGWEVVND